MAENKRPIVYVARKITYYNDYNIECLGGFYVSKAYLNFAGKCYEKDGSVSKEYMVDFINQIELIDSEHELFAETDPNTSKTEVFTTYIDCKYFVKEQNNKLATRVGTTSASKIASRVEFYKKVRRHGEKLEKKYISAEEREKISEDVKSY